MKRDINVSKKTKGVGKGAPSGFVISLAIHVGAFFLAGLLVVFTVQKKKEQKFAPPKPVERPKMKLKKPKVKVKKNAKPKATTRIVTKVQKADMPDIQLPELGGMGTGLEGGAGLGGFEMMPDLDEVTLFGGGQTIGNDFVGTFYDFKRDRHGGRKSMNTDEFKSRVGEFVSGGFRTSRLAQFYQSPKKLYATTFMIPTVKSFIAPDAFGESDTGGWTWMAHYKGNLVYPEKIKFRFWGQGDDILIVRVDKKVVLNASWPGTEAEYSTWVPTGGNIRQWKMGNNYSVPGDWITLEPNEPLEMEVVIGEVPGGHYDAMLCVEVEGEEYPRSPNQAGPVFPMFKTAEPSHDLCDTIYKWLVPGEASVTNGPVFSDFDTRAQRLKLKEEEAAVEETPEEKSPFRIWTLDSGKTVEGEYVSTIGGQLVLKAPDGKTFKVPSGQVSAADREYLDLSNPPKFKVDFVKSPKQRFIETTPYLNEDMPAVLVWTFGAKVKQMSSVDYNHELEVEYIAIGQQELDSNKYMMLDRDSTTFTQTKENKRSMMFKGDRRPETMTFSMHTQNFGERYRGFLVLVRDERGEIIAHNAYPDWLYDVRENLLKLKPRNYFDKTGKRVYPTGPKPDY